VGLAAIRPMGGGAPSAVVVVDARAATAATFGEETDAVRRASVYVQLSTRAAAAAAFFF